MKNTLTILTLTTLTILTINVNIAHATNEEKKVVFFFEKFALISNLPQEYPRLAVLLKPILTLASGVKGGRIRLAPPIHCV
jgi:hypothetical protein